MLDIETKAEIYRIIRNTNCPSNYEKLGQTKRDAFSKAVIKNLKAEGYTKEQIVETLEWMKTL